MVIPAFEPKSQETGNEMLKQVQHDKRKDVEQVECDIFFAYSYLILAWRKQVLEIQKIPEFMQLGDFLYC